MQLVAECGGITCSRVTRLPYTLFDCQCLWPVQTCRQYSQKHSVHWAQRSMPNGNDGILQKKHSERVGRLDLSALKWFHYYYYFALCFLGEAFFLAAMRNTAKPNNFEWGHHFEILKKSMHFHCYIRTFKLNRIESHRCKPTSSTLCLPFSTATKRTVELAKHQDRVEFKPTKKQKKMETRTMLCAWSMEYENGPQTHARSSADRQ